jgi:tripartite-type tricarboxylate transporter receptor subunit TctC
MLRRRFGNVVLVTMLFVFVCVPFGGSWAAEKYPSRYITLVHGYPGAGMAEANNQLIAKALKKVLGVDVIVEGKAGGGGVVATNAIITGPSDGYAIGHQSFMSIVQTALMSKGTVTMDSIRVLGQIQAINQALVVAADAPWKTLQEFMDYVKKTPGVQYANAGVGNSGQVRWENINRLTGLKMVGIPFKGDTEVIAAILGKHSPIGICGIPSAMAQAEAGKLRILMTFENPKMSGLDPKVPYIASFFPKSVSEKDIESVNFLFVNKKTPEEIVSVLEKAMEKACKDPEFIAANQKLGLMTLYLEPKAAAAKLKRMFEQAKEIVE